MGRRRLQTKIQLLFGAERHTARVGYMTNDKITTILSARRYNLKILNSISHFSENKEHFRQAPFGGDSCWIVHCQDELFHTIQTIAPPR